jgi:hypothetical protein
MILEIVVIGGISALVVVLLWAVNNALDSWARKRG